MVKQPKRTEDLKFAIGDYVAYSIADNVLFYGEVVKAEKKRGFKPYTIKADDGSEKYANEEFLKAAKRK